MRDDQLRFQDMAEAIKQIEKYTVSGKTLFERDELVQIWVIHHLQVLGEAARGVSEESQQKFDAIPWGKIIGFRNILVHHYFAVNSDEIWAVVQTNLPPLKKELERIKAQLPTGAQG
jgi:uncharacterized protein with HEPN domain